MKTSLVLVVGLTPTCTELARHLVLSGINLYLLDHPTLPESDKTVSQSDYEEDFLFSKEDHGQFKGDVIKSKLSEMNPFAKIEYKRDLTLESAIAKISQDGYALSAVIYGVRQDTPNVGTPSIVEACQLNV